MFICKWQKVSPMVFCMICLINFNILLGRWHTLNFWKMRLGWMKKLPTWLDKIYLFKSNILKSSVCKINLHEDLDILRDNLSNSTITEKNPPCCYILSILMRRIYQFLAQYKFLLHFHLYPIWDLIYIPNGLFYPILAIGPNLLKVNCLS